MATAKVEKPKTTMQCWEHKECMEHPEMGKECGKATPFGIGDTVLIRTVTMIDVGRILHLTESFVVLEDGGWIADTGRFGECLAKGTFNEAEVSPEPFSVSRASIVEIFKWPGKLPLEGK